MDTATAILVIGMCIIALGLSVCAFAFKYMALSVSAGLLWLIIAFFRLLAGQSDADAPLGMFCLLFSIVMFLSMAFLRQKPPEPVEEDTYTRMARRIEKMRGSTESFKAKGKDIIL